MKNPNKNFEEDRPRPTTSGANMGVFKAAPRPVTSHGRQNQGVISAHQQQILKDIMMGGKQLIRPQTAATTTKKDEDRIKKQMKYFEMLESKIDADLEKMNQ